jgi:hypothetical protein
MNAFGVEEPSYLVQLGYAQAILCDRDDDEKPLCE